MVLVDRVSWLWAPGPLRSNGHRRELDNQSSVRPSTMGGGECECAPKRPSVLLARDTGPVPAPPVAIYLGHCAWQ